MTFHNNFLLVSFILTCFLIGASTIGALIKFKVGNNPVIINLNQRINAWWIMIIFCLPAIYLGLTSICVFFALISFFSLKEFFNVANTDQSHSDKFSIKLCFFLIIPIQFFLIWYDWYGLFSIFIPVYIFFCISLFAIFTQNTQNFLQRISTIQWAVMLCIYGISHIAAIYQLKIPNFNKNAEIILFFLIVAQISDVFQYIFGKIFGKHSLSAISPNKTWEGLILGGLSASIVGYFLRFLTPFIGYKAWLLAILIVITGFFGGLILSAVKRSLNSKDWGNTIPGHGGFLDRVDSLALSAPIFFHVVRYFYT